MTYYSFPEAQARLKMSRPALYRHRQAGRVTFTYSPETGKPIVSEKELNRFRNAKTETRERLRKAVVARKMKEAV